MAGFTYSLKDMLRKFGVVTVMDVEFYKAERYAADAPELKQYEGDWDATSTLSEKAPLFKLDTLKISNINQEGPTKSINGGMNADVLLKYGKTYTVEMQDALGKIEVLEHIYGANIPTNGQFVAFSDGFPGELTVVGKTFVIDQKTGAKQPIRIVIPLFLSDGIFNLTMDAEGDATVFDLNGSILAFETGRAQEGAVGEGEGEKLYKPGSDSLFYFFATEDGYKELKKGFESAWDASSPTEIA